MRKNHFVFEKLERAFGILEDSVFNPAVMEISANSASYQIGANILERLNNQIQFLHSYVIYRLLDTAVRLIANSKNHSGGEIENAIPVVVYLIEQGHWDMVSEAVRRYIHHVQPESKLQTVLLFAEALCLEKTDSLQKAYDVWGKIDFSKIENTTYKNMMRFYRTNLTRLLGYYDTAIEEYENIIRDEYAQLDINSIENILFIDSFSIRLYRQYADMLILKGKFVPALEITTNLLKFEDNPVERAELYRLAGHIFKFNNIHDIAKDFYEKALMIAENNHLLHLKGELYVNLLETSTNPDYLTISNAFKINEELGDMIELGKAHSAYALLLARSGDFEKAKEHADKSIAIQKEKGYQSGILFGLHAHLQIAIYENNKEQVEKILTEMENMIQNLNVYRFLTLPAYVYLERECPYLKEVEFLRIDEDGEPEEPELEI